MVKQTSQLWSISMVNTKKSSRPLPYYRIELKNAPPGATYTLYLEKPYKVLGGGRISEPNFAITIPKDDAGPMKLKVHVPRQQRNTPPFGYSQQFQLKKNITLDLTPPQTQTTRPIPSLPTQESPQVSQKKFLTNKLKAKVQRKKQQVSQAKSKKSQTKTSPTKKKQLRNQLKSEVQTKKTLATKKKTSHNEPNIQKPQGFWAKLKSK